MINHDKRIKSFEAWFAAWFHGVSKQWKCNMEMAYRRGYDTGWSHAHERLGCRDAHELVAEDAPPKRYDARGPARYTNEAGQLVEDDDVPEEDWP